MSAQLFIDHPDDLIDRPRQIHAVGLAEGVATLTTDFVHADGSIWQSVARFDIDGSGVLNLDTAAPIEGDWSLAEPGAFIWALRKQSGPTDPSSSESLAPRELKLQLYDAKGEVATATLTQRILADGVVRREVREQGLSGTLFTPPGTGPFPLVIVLNGSGGGMPESRAALFAAKGYLSLALGYFKAPGRPDYISETPLEYFEQALIWARQALQPRADFIAVAGHSRGGELALLLGATYPDLVSAVMGYVPSAVVHGTLRAGRPDEPRDAVAWTYQGQPLRNIWQENPAADWHAFDHPPEPGAPIRQAPAFVAVEQHAASLTAARIPVERIAGPVLLISGSDDGFWPSRDYCRRIEETLRAHRHRWPVEHVENNGAGHAIGFPGVPTTDIARVHPVAGVVIDGGGTALENARANQRSWERVLVFLAAATSAQS